MLANPRSSASCWVSNSTTGRPALMRLMAMPPPMVPAPMTPTLRMGRSGVSSGTSLNLRGRALGLKHVPQRRRLRRQHQRGKQFALAFETRLEGSFDRRRHRLDAGQRCGIGTCGRLHRIARKLKERLGVRHVQCDVADSFARQFLRDHAARKTHGAHRASPLPRRHRTAACRAVSRRLPWRPRRSY